MAVTIGDVTIRIGASTKTLNRDLRNAERSLQASAAKFKSLGQSLSLSLTAPFAALAGVSLINYDKQIQAIGQVETALRTTGAASGKTSQELQKLASSLQAVTTFGDEEILQKSTAQLLTFTNIAGDVFDKAQLQALNLSTRIGVDLQQASIQLGKALNDPIQGINSLKKSGVSFSDEQKKLIKRLVETGQAVKAQELILGELEKQYGGSAEAAAKLGLGPLKQLKGVVGDLSEEFGATIARAILPFIETLKKLVISFQGIDDSTKSFIVALGGVLAAVGPLVYIFGVLKGVYGSIVIAVTKTAIALTAKTATTVAETAATRVATATTITFNTALRATLITLAPYALALGAIVAIGYAISKSIDKANAATIAYSNITKEVAIEVDKEKSKAEDLIKVVNDETKSKHERNKALKDLQALNPEYFKGLTIEKDGLKRINQQYTDYISNLESAAAARAADKEYDKIFAKKIELQSKLNNEVARGNRSREEAGKFDESRSREGVNYAQIAADNSDRIQEGIKNEIALLDQQKKQLQDLVGLNFKPVKVVEDDGDKPVSDLNKKLQKLNVELTNIKRQFDAGLITSQEASAQRAAILRQKLEALVNSGVKPTSDAIIKLKKEINELNNLQPLSKLEIPNVADKFKQALEQFKSAETPTDLLSSLTNLEKFQTNIKAATKQAAETTKKNLSEGLKGKVTFQTSAYQEWFNEFNNELSDIQLKTDSGLVTSIQGDVEKLNFLKEALNNLKSQGLGQGNIKFDAVQGEIDKIGFGTKFLSSAQDAIGKIDEFVTPVVNQLGNVFSQIFANRTAELDAYYEKERSYIEGSAISEEAKAAKIKALDEDVAKKKRAIARKQAIADKAAAVFGAAVEGARAIISAFGKGPIYGAIVSGIVAAQIAAIAATPLPSLAIGTDYVKQDGLAMLHKGEAVVPADVAGGGFSRGRNAMVNVSGRIQGTDIILVSDYAMDFKTRIR